MTYDMVCEMNDHTMYILFIQPFVLCCIYSTARCAHTVHDVAPWTADKVAQLSSLITHRSRRQHQQRQEQLASDPCSAKLEVPLFLQLRLKLSAPIASAYGNSKRGQATLSMHVLPLSNPSSAHAQVTPLGQSPQQHELEVLSRFQQKRFHHSQARGSFSHKVAESSGSEVVNKLVNNQQAEVVREHATHTVTKLQRDLTYLFGENDQDGGSIYAAVVEDLDMGWSADARYHVGDLGRW